MATGHRRPGRRRCAVRRLQTDRQTFIHLAAHRRAANCRAAIRLRLRPEVLTISHPLTTPVGQVGNRVGNLRTDWHSVQASHARLIVGHTTPAAQPLPARAFLACLAPSASPILRDSEAAQDGFVSLKLYLVSCDLLQDAGYASLRARLRTFEARPVLANEWALYSTYTARQLKDILKGFLHEGDSDCGDGSRHGAGEPAGAFQPYGAMTCGWSVAQTPGDPLS